MFQLGCTIQRGFRKPLETPLGTPLTPSSFGQFWVMLFVGHNYSMTHDAVIFLQAKLAVRDLVSRSLFLLCTPVALLK